MIGYSGRVSVERKCVFVNLIRERKGMNMILIIVQSLRRKHVREIIVEVSSNDTLSQEQETWKDLSHEWTSRAELNEHIRMVHPGQRLPTKQHRRLGRSVNINITNAPTQETQVTPTEPETPDEGFMTESEPATVESETEVEGMMTEGEGEESGEGFTDNDEAVYDGKDGLLD